MRRVSASLARLAIFALLAAACGAGNDREKLVERSERTWTDETRVTHGEARSLRVLIWRDPTKALRRPYRCGHSDIIESQVEPAIPMRNALQTVTSAFLDYTFSHSDRLAGVLTMLGDQGHTVESELGLP